MLRFKWWSFLGAFATFRKANFSFVMFVSPSVCPCLSAWNNSALTWRIFLKTYIWVFFENLSGKFKFYWNLTTITVLYMKTYVHLWSYLAEFFLEWEIFQIKVVEKIKTHVLYFYNLCAINCSGESDDGVKADTLYFGPFLRHVPFLQCAI